MMFFILMQFGDVESKMLLERSQFLDVFFYSKLHGYFRDFPAGYGADDRGGVTFWPWFWPG